MPGAPANAAKAASLGAREAWGPDGPEHSKEVTPLTLKAPRSMGNMVGKRHPNRGRATILYWIVVMP